MIAGRINQVTMKKVRYLSRPHDPGTIIEKVGGVFFSKRVDTRQTSCYFQEIFLLRKTPLRQEGRRPANARTSIRRPHLRGINERHHGRDFLTTFSIFAQVKCL